MSVPPSAIKLLKLPFRGLGLRIPKLKNNTGVIVKFRSTSNIFQRINLPLITKFHVSATICNEEVYQITPLEVWNLVSQSTGCLKRLFDVCLNIEK